MTAVPPAMTAALAFTREGWPDMTATAQTAGITRDSTAPAGTRRAGFGGAVRSEITKIRSVRSTYWTLLIVVLVTIGLGALASAGAASHAREIDRAGFDAVQNSLGGLYVAQLVIAVLGALTITSEYSTGMIRTSLSVQPRRGTLFAAKALVFAVVSLVTGLVACFASFFIGQAILSGHHLGVTLGQPDVLRAVIGGALFLAVCGMLAYGLGAILRSTAAAITGAVGLLFVLSVLVNFLPQSWQVNVDKWMPAIAGSQVWVTRTSPADHAFSAWAGFGVFAAYAAIAVVAGLILFRRRDA
jgi:ABC-2 type transport system permease protein